MKNQSGHRNRRGPHAQAGQRRELKRDEILDAAARLFATHGYDATSMADLAAELAVTKAALYYYVSGKHELLNALLERSLDRLEDAIDDARNASIDPVERLRAVIRGHVLEASHQSRTLLIFVRAGGASGTTATGGVSAENRRRAGRYTRDVTALVEHGQSTGVLRADLDARVVAFAMIGMCNWVASWYDPGGPMAADEVARQYATMLTESLLA